MTLCQIELAECAVLSLRDVLRHPAVAAAAPEVRAGDRSLERLVRWVHSSEVFEIAHLLQGGELLLSGGVVLATTDAAAQRRYMRELAGRQVAGVAIETGSALPELPPALVEEAGALEFPLVELRRVVPFVTITEAINGLLVNASVQELRAADALSHALSAELAHGGGPQDLLRVLAERSVDAVLFDTSGVVLAGPADAADFVDPAGQAPWSVPIAVQGVRIATLIVRSRRGAVPEAVHAVLDRAPEAFALALLRGSTPSAADHAAQELLRVLAAGTPSPDLLGRLGRAAGVPGDSSYVAVVARSLHRAVPLATIEATVRQRGRRTLSTVTGGELRVVVVLPAAKGRVGRQARERLLADLAAVRRAEPVRVAVSRVESGLVRLSRAMNEAALSLDLATALGLPEVVVDAEQVAVERLAVRLAADDLLREFIDEELGALLRLGQPKADRLIKTLETYLRSGCHKTAAARELRLQRQTLYQRLEQIYDLLGGDPAGTPRAAAIHLAARLYVSGVVDVAHDPRRSG